MLHGCWQMGMTPPHVMRVDAVRTNLLQIRRCEPFIILPLTLHCIWWAGLYLHQYRNPWCYMTQAPTPQHIQSGLAPTPHWTLRRCETHFDATWLLHLIPGTGWLQTCQAPSLPRWRLRS